MAASGENPQKDYIVGGGQFRLAAPGAGISCSGVNFGLSAHVDQDAPTRIEGVGGSLTLTVPENNPSGCEHGHLVARPDCVDTNDARFTEREGIFTVAVVTATVTRSSGALAVFPAESRVEVIATEGFRSNDALGVGPAAESPCSGFAQLFAIERGNIRIDGN